jgi:hypothetical protein
MAANGGAARQVSAIAPDRRSRTPSTLPGHGPVPPTAVLSSSTTGDGQRGVEFAGEVGPVGAEHGRVDRTRSSVGSTVPSTSSPLEVQRSSARAGAMREPSWPRSSLAAHVFARVRLSDVDDDESHRVAVDTVEFDETIAGALGDRAGERAEHEQHGPAVALNSSLANVPPSTVSRSKVGMRSPGPGSVDGIRRSRSTSRALGCSIDSRRSGYGSPRMSEVRFPWLVRRAVRRGRRACRCLLVLACGDTGRSGARPTSRTASTRRIGSETTLLATATASSALIRRP